ncbi:MAG TPA: 3-phosphoserine/phosphohydroxythreonine transaminase [Polyangiaceae bacterium]|nr:3-phosphoserine/phosphohydroxythreonine transaminase [Polyangiaceae bacterium]
MARVMNFSAGPAALPAVALLRARDELLDWQGTGMSVMEQSHRGKAYERLHQEALSLLAKHLQIGTDKTVLLLQGGATQCFATVPMNLLRRGREAEYVVTGVWGEKALGEATQLAGPLGASAREVPWEGSRKGTRAPRATELTLSDDAAYLHTTSNETIHGVQLGLTPETPFPSSRAPHVCDMSSDFLGRRLDMSRFALVYAGAQKNLGPSGVVVVVADNELMAGARDDVPDIFRFAVHAKHGSLFNTPPTLAIYLVRNVLLWLEGQGGIEAIERQNEEKARLVYAEIDRAPDFYRCPVELGSRSLMNVVFRLPTAELEARFVADAAAGGMVGLKGHRSVGGVRASLYNAVPVAAAQSLASFMREFHRTCVA